MKPLDYYLSNYALTASISMRFSYALTVWNPVRLKLYVGGIILRMYTKIALTIAVTVITTKLVLHIEEQRKIRNLHNRVTKLVQID